MSVTYINAELRRLVEARAAGICEYCLLAEEDTFFGLQFDHIISEKHGGPTHEDYLAHVCLACNQAKGSDIGSIHWDTGDFVRFFNPRTDRWAEHFELAEARIEGITPIGSVTARILQFNANERLLEREIHYQIGRYPSPTAVRRLEA